MSKGMRPSSIRTELQENYVYKDCKLFQKSILWF